MHDVAKKRNLKTSKTETIELYQNFQASKRNVLNRKILSMDT